MMTAEMSLSVLYMYELHHRNKLSRSYHDLEARTAYQFQDPGLPSIQEDPDDGHHGYQSPRQLATASLSMPRYQSYGHRYGSPSGRGLGPLRQPDVELNAMNPLINLSGALGSPVSEDEPPQSPLSTPLGSPEDEPPRYQQTHDGPHNV